MSLLFLLNLLGIISIICANQDDEINTNKIPWCFGNSLKLYEKEGPITGLLSYPGSGNTWLRYLIQRATGYVTGSVYFSTVLYQNGFPGEKLDNGSAIVVKSHLGSFLLSPHHHENYKEKKIDYFKKKLVIVRNPLDAAISYFNECWNCNQTHCPRTTGFLPYLTYLDIDTHKIVGGKLSKEYVPLEVYKKEYFVERFQSELKIWMEFHDEILEKCTSNCHIVLYDNIKRNIIPEMTKILKFLGFEMTEEIKNCLLSPGTKGKFKRKKRPKEEIDSIYGLFPEANLTSYKNVYENYIEKLTKLEKLNKEAKCLSSEKEGIRL